MQRLGRFPTDGNTIIVLAKLDTGQPITDS